MATLRLFAGLREAAGTDRIQISGATVGEVLDEAVSRFGASFAEGVSRARVWLNGEEAERSDPVSEGDEVAVLPPVSGGAQAVGSASATADLAGPLLTMLALVLANMADGAAWWAAAVVGVAGLWVGDVATTGAGRGRDLPVVPPLLSILAAVVAVHLLGSVGLGLALVAAVVLTLTWGVASDSSRMLQTLAPAMVVSVVATTAAGSLLLTRLLFDPGVRAAGVLLAVASVAVLLGLLFERLRAPVGDPFTATALGAIVASLVAAALWDLDLVAFLITGIALAVALIAGRALGSILRTRQVMLLDRPPGSLALLDGVVLAAAIYHPLLDLLA